MKSIWPRNEFGGNGGESAHLHPTWSDVIARPQIVAEASVSQEDAHVLVCACACRGVKRSWSRGGGGRVRAGRPGWCWVRLVRLVRQLQLGVVMKKRSQMADRDGKCQAVVIG